MKKIMLLAFVFMIGCGSASVKLSEKSNIINLPGQSKHQIFKKSAQWITYKFVSGRAVMDYKDLNSGRIIAKGSISLGMSMSINQLANIVATIDCVNDRAKISIILAGCGTHRGGDCPCNNMYIMQSALDKIDPEIENFINDYRGYMTGGKAPAWDGK